MAIASNVTAELWTVERPSPFRPVKDYMNPDKPDHTKVPHFETEREDQDYLDLISEDGEEMD